MAELPEHQSLTEKARMVLAELRHLIEHSQGPWTWDEEDLAASLPEVMEALQKWLQQAER
jgi:hypothetical protein